MGGCPGEWGAWSCCRRGVAATAYRGGREGFGSPRGRRAHLALAGVARVRRGQLRAQQAFCAVTQSLCEDKNSLLGGKGEAGGKSPLTHCVPRLLRPRAYSYPQHLDSKRRSPLSPGVSKENLDFLKSPLQITRVEGLDMDRGWLPYPEGTEDDQDASSAPCTTSFYITWLKRHKEAQRAR